MTRALMFIASIGHAAPRSMACPLCDSDTARETRAGIFNDDFFATLTGGSLPFLVVAAIATAIHVDWRKLIRPKAGWL